MAKRTAWRARIPAGVFFGRTNANAAGLRGLNECSCPPSLRQMQKQEGHIRTPHQLVPAKTIDGTLHISTDLAPRAIHQPR